MKISQESYLVACAVLKCASKTSIKNAANELDAIFYSPQELRKQHHIREMWRQELKGSLAQETPEN